MKKLFKTTEAATTEAATTIATKSNKKEVIIATVTVVAGTGLSAFGLANAAKGLNKLNSLRKKVTTVTATATEATATEA